MFAWALSLLSLDSLSAAWKAWHSTPQNCRDRVLTTVAFCLGTDSDRRLVGALELTSVFFASALAFLLGRLTAKWDLGLHWSSEHKEIAFVGAPKSRFSDDAGRGARAGERGGLSARSSY
jgi:hypothetical protein